MLPSNFDSIALKDIQALIDNSAKENSQLEFKRELRIKTTGEKKEFLFDVNSFANSSGADMVFGIEEGTGGVASELRPIEIVDTDEYIRRVENILIDGFAPRMFGIRMKLIPVIEDDYIFIVRIPPQGDDLYEVCFDNAGKYYIRLHNSRHQIKGEEIRKVIVRLHTSKTKREEFVKARIANINSDLLPVALQYPAKVILMIIPQNAFTPRASCPVTTQEASMLPPLGGGGRNPGYNADGMLTNVHPNGFLNPISYLQLYENGIIETVNSYILEPDQSNLWVRCKELEGYLVREIQIYINFYKNNNVALPAHLYLALTGIMDYTLGFDGIHWFMNKPQKFTIDKLELAEIRISDYTQDIPSTLKQWFDKIWQAGGKPRSLHYDDSGKWLAPVV